MISPVVSAPVVKKVWGSPDCLMLFFAGSAAEFAAIKAVDWLYYTGKLPSAPIDRFFDTVEFAQKIIFFDSIKSTQAVDTINKIHQQVQLKRSMQIPNWAFMDVLFMLVDYGEK